MTEISSHFIPVELMEILERINKNISEVKDRITRIEAQDHSDNIKTIRSDINTERNERMKLQMELESIKTRFAPLVVATSVAGAAIIQLIIQSVKF